MSTSPKPAPAAEPEPAFPAQVQPFPYALLPPGSTRGGERLGGVVPWTTEVGLEESASREARARAEGRAEGLAEACKLFEERLARERAGLATALAQFTRDRAAYFPQIEREVVELALAIARKILHREAQLDPLLLAGIVRVALEKIDGATGVRLHVNPENAADWRRYLATHMEPADLPEIVEDTAQSTDSCSLETSMGTAAVGLEVQLKEIEQGLMDLLAARPGAVR